MNKLLILIPFVLSLHVPRYAQSQEVTPNEILANYEGDWLIGGKRDRTRVVANTDCKLELYSRISWGCFGVAHRSMRIEYDENANEFTAKLKWSTGSADEHFKSNWTYQRMRGAWDEKTRTMYWTTGSNDIPALEIEHCFLNANIQTTTIRPVNWKDFDRVRNQITKETLFRLH